MAASVRVASSLLPQSEVVFFRNFFALLFLLPLLWRSGQRLATRRLGLHLLRAVSGLAAMYLYFYALARLPLADALLLNYTSPLFIAFFAVLWLGEEMTGPRLVALSLGLVGVALLFHPSSAIASLAGLLGLASGALAGLAMASVKKLSATEPAIRIVVWFALLATLMSAVPMLVGGLALPTAEGWMWLIGIGLFGNVGQLGLTKAYAMVPASQVSPLGYSSLLFAGLIGFFGWGELWDLLGWLGAATISTAGILVARERTEPLPEPPSAVPVFEVHERPAADRHSGRG